MTISHFKNIIISSLVVLAIFQTSLIWFQDTEGDFLSVFAIGRQQEVGGEFRRSFALPMRIVTGDGSHNFRTMYIGMSDNNNVAREFCDGVILAALSGDEMPRRGSPGFADMLRGDIIIYEYAFEMPTDEFMRALGLRPGALGMTIERFNMIVFSAVYNSGVSVYFHNRNTDVWAGYFVSDAELSRKFSEIVQVESGASHTSINFASSFLIGIDENPYNNLFIPVWNEQGHRYFVGEVRPAHFDPAVGAVMQTIRENIMSFFDTPAVIYDVPTVGGFAWADESTIVRHFANNVLQYISYSRDLRNSEFLDDFARALDFIAEKDLLMTNDFYLSGFRENNNERVFYFEYILEGLPVIFSDALRNSISEHTTSAITVRFRDGNLVNYTRLAYTFAASSENTEIANRDLPLYILNSGLDLESLESITLAFVAPILDLADVSAMNLWVDFRMQGGISAMESLSIDMDM